jgi:hypothetical protein
MEHAPSRASCSSSIRWVEVLSHLQRMMFERASPSLQSRKLLRAGGQGRAGNMLTGFMLRGFAGDPTLASNRIDALRRSHVTDRCDASVGDEADESARTKCGAPFHKFAAFMGEVFETSESI